MNKIVKYSTLVLVVAAYTYGISRIQAYKMRKAFEQGVRDCITYEFNEGPYKEILQGHPELGPQVARACIGDSIMKLFYGENSRSEK